MDTSQGSQGHLIAGAGGALLIIFLFLPWAGAAGVNASGWELFTVGDIFFLIAGLVGIGAALSAGGALMPGLSLNGAAALLGSVATVMLLWLLIFDWPDGPSRKIWIFLAVVAAALIAFGGYSAAQNDRT